MYCGQLAEREVDDVREGKTVGKDVALLGLNAGICTPESPVAVGPLGDSVKKKRVRDVSDKCTKISNALLRSSWHFYVTGSQATLRMHMSKTSTSLNFNFSYVSLVQYRVLYSFVGFRECLVLTCMRSELLPMTNTVLDVH